MSKPIDTVVFDIGNVLLDWDRRYLYRKLIADEAEMEAFLRDVCPMSWHGQQDAGRSCAEAISDRIALFPQYENLIRAHYERWDETIGGPIEGSVALLHELKRAGLRVYALTNFPDELFLRAQHRYDFLWEFAGIVVSGRERLIKPDPAIYRVLFERYAIQPEAAIFIDDSLPNILTAQELGMHTVHFLGADKLRTSLRELRLPV
ncbi:MAG TPA: HAD family phosphatase [Rhodocyclaceae bacterium]|nr:HAD family phosphatase [Rhodocyclaceae bacterium]